MKQEQDQVAWKGEWQTSVPDRLFEAELSGMAKLLWISLKRYVSRTSPHPFPGRHTLCVILGVGVSSFKKYRRELEQKGWLERTDRRGLGGMFYGNIYTLCVPGNCKQKTPVKSAARPGVKLRSPVIQPPVIQPPVKQPPKEYQVQKETKFRKNTNTEGAADAAGDVDVGVCFLRRWKDTYQQWFKSPYISKPDDAQKAKELMKELKCRPKDLLAYVFRMWINTTDFDEPDSDGYDPLFNQIKGSRSIRFFLRYISEIADEQKQPLDCCLTAEEKEFQDLEKKIAKGRG